MESNTAANTTVTPSTTTPVREASQPVTPAGTLRAGQSDQPAVQNSVMTDMLKELFNDQIKAAMDQAMLPLSTTIEQEVANLQAEADSITLRGEAEHAQVNKELAELAQLVHTFQSHIAQVLPGNETFDQHMQNHQMSLTDQQ